MKWIPLKIYQGNVLAKELETVTVIYNDLVSAVKITQSKEAINNYNTFKEEIKKRIKELNDFYAKYINDNRIGMFENVKNKLEKLLTIKPKLNTNNTSNISKIKKSSSQKIIVQNTSNSRNNSVDRSNSNKASKENTDIIDNTSTGDCFTSDEKIFTDKFSEYPQWKEAFIELHLSELEYNILFKDNE